MSGIVQNNTVRSSGTIAVAASGLNWDSAVITASTLTAEAGKGYFINTTSNICTITLPSAAEVGDQIVFVDYARTWGTYKIVIDSNGLNYQGDADTFTVEYNTSGETLDIVYSGTTKGWIPQNDDIVADAPVAPPTQKGIFAFGNRYIPDGDQSVTYGMSNKVNSSGVVIADTAGTSGELNTQRAAATYGTDKAIFAFGQNGSSQNNTINLVNNQGVVAANSTGTGSARLSLAATAYGIGGTAIFAYGIQSGTSVNKSNKVSNTGGVASDTSGVGTARHELGASPFGSSGQGIFAFGYSNTAGSNQNISNIVSNTGVIASDQSGVGTARGGLAAAQFGDRCIFGYGAGGGPSNMVSTTGVVASDVSRVGTSRIGVAGAPYGGNKGLFCFGNAGSSVYVAVSNLVSTSGVIASDTSAVSGVTIRAQVNGAGYSISA